MRNTWALAIGVLVALCAAVGCSEAHGGDGDAGMDAALVNADGGSDGGGATADTGHDADAVDAFVADDAAANVDANADSGITCGAPFVVCAGQCVNTANDIRNCGACNDVCSGAHPFCDAGTCGTAPCTGATCGAPGFCCGSTCCTAGQLCCDVPGPISAGPRCTDPVGGTCPMGCPLCVCASPDTLIATPRGERRIADLVVGDLVYSADEGALRVVPIAEVHQSPVSDHRVMRVELETGRVLEISPGHPTADGRWFGDLRAGDRLDGVLVLSAELVPYMHGFTYDILPASETGTYVAGGTLIGSTLAGSGAPVALDVVL